MLWQNYKIEYIISAKNADNVPLLELFLIDYSKEFNTTNLNASCKKCLKEYLNKYKSKFNKMENKTNYVLHKKREGLQLTFGEAVFNHNLTDAKAKKLITKFKKLQGDDFKIEFLFSKYPPETKQTEDKPKRKKRTRKTTK